MTSGGPWSVKGIDPKAREIAKDLARRSGMTLGEWINQLILEGEDEGEALPEPVRPPERPRIRTSGQPLYPPPSARLSSGFSAVGGRGHRAAAALRRDIEEEDEVSELGRVTAALERLSERIEAAERRSTLAISGIDQSVAGALARLEQGEREQGFLSVRVDEALESVREAQARASDRLDRIETDEAPKRSAEALRSLEQALARVAGQLYESESRTQAALAELRQDVDGAAPQAEREVSARLEERLAESEARGRSELGSLRETLETVRAQAERAERAVTNMPAPEPFDPAPALDSVVARVTDRIESAETRTAEALRAMEASFAALDARLGAAEARLAEPVVEVPEADRPQAMFERLAADLHDRVEASRAELAETLARDLDGRSDARLGRLEDTIRELTRHVETAERRSAEAIESMGREVLRVAEVLGRRIGDADARAGEAGERADQMADRIAASLDQRIRGADTAQAEAIERLGAEITRISERLAERIGASERRSAQAIDEVGEQVARVTDKINQRYDRSSQDLSDRLRQSEERTARLLEDARERIDQRIGEVQRRTGEQLSPVQQAVADLASRIDGMESASPFGAAVFEPSPFAPMTRSAAPAPAIALDPAPVAEDRRSEEGRATFDPFADFDAEPEPTAPEPEAPAAEARAPEDSFPDFLADLAEFPAIDAEEAAPRSEAELEPVAPAADDPFASFLEDEAPLAASHDAHPVVTSAAEAPEAAEKPLSTRDILEQARAAARAASQGEDRPQASRVRASLSTTLPPLPGGLRSERAPRATLESGAGGSPLRTALFVSAALATVSVGAWGYWWLNRTPPAPAAAPAADSVASEPAAASAPSAESVAAAPEAQAVPPAADAARQPAPAAAAVPGASAAAGAGPAAAPTSVPPAAAASAAPRPAPAAAQSPAAPPANPARVPAATSPGQQYAAAMSQLGGAQRSQGLQALQSVAQGGYAPAQFMLAKVYEEGRFGVPRDATQARRWTERAAQGGEARAMHNLALFLFEGTGGAQDRGQAAQWFRRAADANVADSQYNLARLYEQGLGVSRNPAEAYKWYLIAGANGDADSRAAAQRLRSGLTADARSAAERSAAAFRAQRGQPAVAAPAATAAAPTADAAASNGDPATAAAQRGLSRLGYYRGPADGAASPALRAAVQAYQRQQGLPATGEVDDALIARLSGPAVR